jgi:hypothetical protein
MNTRYHETINVTASNDNPECRERGQVELRFTVRVPAPFIEGTSTEINARLQKVVTALQEMETDAADNYAHEATAQ